MPGEVPPKAKQKEPTLDSWKGAGTLQRRENGALRVRVKVSGRTRSRTFKAGTKLAKIKQVASDLERELREEGNAVAASSADRVLEAARAARDAGYGGWPRGRGRDRVRRRARAAPALLRRGGIVMATAPPWRRGIPGCTRSARPPSSATWRGGRRTSCKAPEPLGRGDTANRTVDKDRAVLHSALKLAAKLKTRSGDNPAAKAEKFKEPDFLPTILSPAQVDRLIESCRKSRRPCCTPSPSYSPTAPSGARRRPCS